jgi:hypothetical protein
MQYLMKVNGKLTEEKENFIANEEKRLNDANSESNNIADRYIKGEISEEEFILKNKKIDKQLEKADAFKILYDQYKFIKQKPEERFFLYTNGWTNLLAHESLDMILIFLILIIITPIFTNEYEKDMIPLIITSKNGKGIISAYKIIAASIITILVTLSFSLIEYICCYLRYGLPSGSFPLESIMFFGTSKHHISLLQTYLYICLIKVIGFLVFTYFVLFISIILRGTILTLLTSLSLVLVPYFIYLNNSVIYRLPLPLGFMIGNGYFRGSDESGSIAKGAAKFLEVCKQEFLIESFYMVFLLVCLAVMSIILFSKYNRKGVKRFE